VFKTGFLTLVEEYRLRVLETKAMRRMCVPQRDKVTGKQRNFHNEKLHNLHLPPDIT
jgi:lysyl-tRNA synthetase class II